MTTSIGFARLPRYDLIFVLNSVIAASWIRALFSVSTFKFFMRALCSSTPLSDNIFCAATCSLDRDNSVYWKLVFSSDALGYRVIFNKFTHNEHLGLPSVFPSLDSSFFTARLCVQGTAL